MAMSFQHKKSHGLAETTHFTGFSLGVSSVILEALRRARLLIYAWFSFQEKLYHASDLL